jgi:hypothetical protein
MTHGNRQFRYQTLISVWHMEIDNLDIKISKLSISMCCTKIKVWYLNCRFPCVVLKLKFDI